LWITLGSVLAGGGGLHPRRVRTAPLPLGKINRVTGVSIGGSFVNRRA
jgi:hypothetical protein